MLTTAGMIPVIAGLKNALAAPAIAASAASTHIPGSPAISSAAIAPCAASRIRSVVTISARRGSRSAHTPPTSRNATSGTVLRRQHDPEVGRRAGLLEHRERQRHADHAVAEQGDGLAEEQQPERALPQRVEPPGHQSTAARTASATSARGVSEAS